MSPDNVVRLKVAAALAAFAAGIGAVLTVVLLAHSTPSAGATTSGPQAASPPPPPPPATASFPNPPPGAIVLAKEDRDLAVALADSQDGFLQASVIGQEGPAAGLSVSIDGVRADACGPGCYRARAGSGKRVQVAIRGPNRSPSTVSFSLTAPAASPSAAAIVRRADRTWRRLETLVVHDHLSSGPGTAIDTVWRFKAPHQLTYQIRNGPAAVAIGARRWDKLPGHDWQASEQDPITEPIPLWHSVSDAHLLGSATLRGHAVWKVSFFDPQLPAWFTIWVDKATARTLELRMTAQAHFMHQVYGPFNSRMRIVPPA
jgi:hypothetical protein